MPLISGAIPIGATFAPTGGTSRTLTSLGGDKTSVRLLVNDSAAFSLRSLINCSITEPTVNSGYPGGYTPIKRRVARTKPKTLADGSIFTNQAIVELIVHQECVDADINELLSGLGCVVTDGDFTNFWLASSLS
jgi:hypothetical protein